MKAVAGMLLVLQLVHPVAAQPPDAPPVSPEPRRADIVPAGPNPWVDLAPSGLLAPIANDSTQPQHKTAAAAMLGGLYVGFVGWMYYAWYRKHKPLADYKFGGDGWLGDETYAGGADKCGHAWATMSLARLGTYILSDYGGYDRKSSILASTALSELLFIGVEVKDGFFFEFSFSDLAGDTTGALLALAFDLWPRLDEMFDYRVQYFPSNAYAHQVSNAGSPLGGKLNIAEDYSGQTYLLAYHLGSIHALRDMRYGWLAGLVDVAVGFETRGYKPEPATGELPPADHHQHLFIGISLNAQGLLDWALEGGKHEKLRKLSHATFEVFNLPFTSVPVPGLGLDHSPTAEPSLGGA